MSRVLLADDSPHAQRMGELILREEGYEVESVTDGEAALLKLVEFDPDIILADAFLPRRSGFDICREVKNNPKTRHVRVVLTSGVLEPLDEAEASRAGTDGLLKKPFEATIVLETLKPLSEAARQARELGLFPILQPSAAAAAAVSLSLEPDTGLRELSDERVRAAVTLAVDASMPALVEEITRQVLAALRK
jgi:twitching motility two-component system response regulator PilH